MNPNEIITESENLVKYQSFEDVITLMRQHYLVPDSNVIKVTFASIVAHSFSTDPLWLLLIAPPSSMKTETISSLSNISEVYQLSSLTPQTFFSGLRKSKDQTKENALLLKINNKIFTLKDFGSVLSMRYEDKAIILSQLREIYDGSYSARYGNGVEINWKGKVGFIAGVTPIVDTHYSVFQTLGERFIQYRLEAIEEDELGDTAIDLIGSEKSTRKEIKSAVCSFLSQLEVPSVKSIEMPADIKSSIIGLACLCVRARSGVIRDSYRKTLEYVPDPEAPARLAKQLATLAYALAVIDKRKKINSKDYLLVLRVGLDCIPRQRILVLDFLAKENEQTETFNIRNKYKTSEVAEGIDYSTDGAKIHLEDLVAHKLVTVDKHGSGMSNEWFLSDKIFKYLSKISLKRKFFRKNLKKYTSNYNNLINLLLKVQYE